MRANRNASTRTTGAIAPPETISPARSVSLKHGEESSSAFTGYFGPLRDISGHWAQYYIEDLSTRGVVHGFPDGKFRPNQPITPAEFSIMIQNAFPGSANGRQRVPSYRDLQARTSDGAATRADAAAFIHQMLSKSEPALTVTNVEVDGEVAHPGSYSLAAASDPRLGRGNNFPTVTRALQQAGGTLNSANLHQVEIHRITETGAKRVIKVDVAKVLQTGDRTQDLVLQQDDKVVIPTAVSRVQPFITPEKSSSLSRFPESIPSPVPLEPSTAEVDPN